MINIMEHSDGVYAPKDYTRRSWIIVGAVFLFAAVIFYKDILKPDWTVIAVLIGLLGISSLVVCLVLRVNAKKLAIVDENSLVLKSGKKETVYPFEEISSLVRKKVHMGSSHYIAYFLSDRNGKSHMLFPEGLYQDEKDLLEAIAGKARKSWDEEM